MSKTNNYLWNETERHMDLVEQAACQSLLQTKFSEEITKEKSCCNWPREASCRTKVKGGESQYRGDSPLPLPMAPTGR